MAIFCELPEDLYCMENECFQHCCPLYYFYDQQKAVCEPVSDDFKEQYMQEFDAKKPHEDLDFDIVTNLYGQHIDYPDIGCDEDDDIIRQDFTENYVKYLSKGKIDLDGVIIPFGEHCYNQQGNRNIKSSYLFKDSVGVS